MTGTPPRPRRRELAPAASGPLSGVRILDLTSVVLGAYATQMLGDLGADVIKVEFPGADGADGGDIIRRAGPAPDGAELMGPVFMSLNRNKRGLMLDLRDPVARRRFEALICTADVFAATVRLDGLTRLGLDYETVRGLRGDIIYVHGAGFGSDGPAAGEPAYDDLIQAATGCADLLNRMDGDPQPRYLPTLIADKVCGLFMAQAVLAALLHRERTGEGQFVEVPMMESLTSFNLVEHLYGHVWQPPHGGLGYARIANPWRRPFATRDGYIGLLPYTDRQWDAFFEAAGLAGVVGADPRFSDYAARSRHIEDLYALVHSVTPQRTTAQWLACLKPRQVPVVRLNRLDDLMGDEHLAAVGLFETYRHADFGDYVAVRPPVRFSRSPANIRRHAPKPGQHNRELLAEADALLASSTGD